MSQILITHADDMDGAACGVIFRAAFPDGIVYYEDYQTVDARAQEVLETKLPKILYLADISVKSETASKLEEARKQGVNVRLYDHHVTAKPLQKYPWAVIDESACGAYLLWRGLRENKCPSIEAYKDLVVLVDDYDRWVHANPLSLKLNELYRAVGRDYWVERFSKDPRVELSSFEEAACISFRKQMEDYISKTPVQVFEIKPHRVGLAFAEQHISELAHAKIQQLDLDFIIIINFRKGTISFRSKSNIDVSRLAAHLGGGGHSRAAGCQLPEEVKENMKNMMVTILNTIAKKV